MSLPAQAPCAPPVRLSGETSPLTMVRQTSPAGAGGCSLTASHLRLVDDFGPVGTCAADLPDPHLWVSRIALAVFEASTGARPATQVLRFLSPEIYESVVRRSSRAVRRGAATRRPIRLRRVRAALQPVAEDAWAVVEACAVVDDHQRVRVMALRLEGLDGRWVVTACEIG